MIVLLLEFSWNSFGVKPSPKPIKQTLNNKLKLKFNQNTEVFFQEITFQNLIYKMATTFDLALMFWPE